VEFYKRQGNNYRILGLTASPGSEADNVREICKHLDTEEIEVRTRESEDVKNYLQKLDYEKIEVPFPPEFLEMKILLKRIFDSKIGELRNRNLLFGPGNKISLLKLQSRLGKMVGEKNFNAMLGMSAAAQAIKISHAMELLETQTLSGLNEYLKGLVKQSDEKKSKGVQKLVNGPEFKAVLISLSDLLSKEMEHPKVEETAVLVEEEFKQNKEARIIIFTQYRETATKIVERLNKSEFVKASTFFGQAKKGNTGFSQKEQKQIIENLKEGKLNVIVATSIGEEGLDIAEVNVVIFYEPIPSAIRKIQRAGRTARLKAGKLVILVTKDTRDEINHYASSAREKKMHKVIDLVRKEIKDGRKDMKLGSFG
ncbi:MAG: helicase-related protein, partial [Nanoarchaeota archaeon]